MLYFFVVMFSLNLNVFLVFFWLIIVVKGFILFVFLNLKLDKFIFFFNLFGVSFINFLFYFFSFILKILYLFFWYLFFFIKIILLLLEREKDCKINVMNYFKINNNW